LFYHDEPAKDSGCSAARSAIVKGFLLRIKDVNMSTTAPDLDQAGQTRRGNVFTWTATVLACAYIVWTGTMLYFSTPRFIDLYSSLGVELPLLTRIVIGTYRFGYPLWFGGATALVIAKQFYVREKWPNLSISLVAVVLVDIVGRTAVWALYRPLLDLTEKLNK
jgi:hypothetical protein